MTLAEAVEYVDEMASQQDRLVYQWHRYRELSRVPHQKERYHKLLVEATRNRDALDLAYQLLKQELAKTGGGKDG